MKRRLFIVPGWEETGLEDPYKRISSIADKYGLYPTITSIDWSKPLSRQIFVPQKDDIIFGFSLGAVLGRIVAQSYPISLLILASVTPEHNFKDKEILLDFYNLCGKEFVDDMKDSLKEKTMAKRTVVIYGDREGESADVLVEDTEHELTNNYLNEIENVIKDNL